jgi:hypothetical protein
MWGRASDLARRRPEVAIIAIIAGALVLALILSGRETALQTVVSLSWFFSAVFIPLALLKLNRKMKFLACVLIVLLLIAPSAIGSLTTCDVTVSIGFDAPLDLASQDEGWYCGSLGTLARFPLTLALAWFFVFLLYAAVRTGTISPW